MNKKTEQKNTKSKGKVLTGIVTSNKMTDTVVVEVSRYQKHPKYQKFISSRKKYKADDKGNTLNIGDKVKIIETKPISKDKRFRLLEIVEKAPLIQLSDEDLVKSDLTNLSASNDSSELKDKE